jgi:plastocyanin
MRLIPVLSLLLIASASRVWAQSPSTHTITIEGMKFNPESLEVKSGDTIVWINKDFFSHTATAEKKSFDSGEIKADASWKHVMSTKGAFLYKCTLHPTMKGSLTVK